MKIKIIILIILGIASYLYFTDLQPLKQLVGYRVPPLETPVSAEPGVGENNESEFPFLSLPSGLYITSFVSGLDKPRVIEFDPAGRMLVSEPGAGRVIILEDSDGDGKAETKKTLLSNLNKPHGLAFYSDDTNTYLYVAETHQVVRFRYDVKNGRVLDMVGQNIANLPADGRHFTRTIGFGKNFVEKSDLPDQLGSNFLNPIKLYISVGSSCDTCIESDWKRSAILESDPEGTFTAKFASGLRNAVFFTFHPETGEIWTTEMGRDNLGDELPPDEINIVRFNKNYGWPFCYGNKVRDNKFNEPVPSGRIDVTNDCSQTEPSLIDLQAHSAPLGIAFIPGSWPKEWQNDLLVAYHGSWNRTEPTGYKIVRFALDKNNKVTKNEDFISGWLSGDDEKIFGRPVDLKFGPDDALYISDDAAGVIYRVEAVN